MADMLLKNPVNWGTVGLWVGVCLSGILLSSLLIIVEHGFSWRGVAIGLALALIVLIYVPWRLEFLWRPTAVEVDDTGVVLHQRYGRKPLFVPWSDIRMLNVHPVDPVVDHRWHAKDGFLFVNGQKRYYPMKWTIAMKVREAHREHMGRYPSNPTMSGGQGNEDVGKIERTKARSD